MLFQFCIVLILISNCSFTFGSYSRSNSERDVSFYYESKEIFQNVFRSYVYSGENLNTLLVVGTNLNIINDDLFEMSHLQDMKNITLRNCNIQSISEYAFKIFLSLKYLSITGNHLKILNSNFLSSLSNLIELDLSNNEIMNLDMYCGNFQLQNLILNDNPLYNSEKIECKFENLLRLELKNTTMTDLNVSLQLFVFTRNVNKLNILDISNNHILRLNYDFLNFINLKELYLKNTFLSANNFKALVGLNSLETLNLESNKISSISDFTFNNTKNLKHLNLKNTSLSAINYNAFEELKFLEILNLELNKISKIPCNSFKDTRVLKTLKLNNNDIDVIFICSFIYLESLTHLYLQHNNISNIQVGTFSSLSHLEYLDISYNKLKNIDETAIHPLERIEVLDISGNFFKNLDPALVFGHLKLLKQIDLSGNFWTCSNLSYARKYLRLRDIKYESKIMNFDQENIGGIQCFSNISDSILNENKSQSNNSTNMPISNSFNYSTLLENITGILNEIKNQHNNLTNMPVRNNYNTSTLLEQIKQLLIFIIILLICYLCVFIGEKIYNKSKFRKNVLNRYNSTKTEIELLNSVADETEINS